MLPSDKDDQFVKGDAKSREVLTTMNFDLFVEDNTQSFDLEA